MWNDLTMSERADVIKMAVKAGLRDMKSIRKFYDDSLKYAEGGPKVTYGKPYYSYDKNMQIETDNGKPILNYSATLPEVNIIPDSKKSPADRNEARRFREKLFSDNAEREDRDYTQRQIMKSQRDWDNSLEKKALGYAQDFMTGVGIGADIASGLPIYSSLKGARVLSEANSLPEYIEGGLWLAPIGKAAGKGAIETGKVLYKKALGVKPFKAVQESANNVNWDPDYWFKDISGRTSYSQEEASELASHVPEYRNIEKELFKEGKLVKDFNGNIIVKNSEMSPQEYIMRQSEAFKKMNPEHHYVGVSEDLKYSFENEPRAPETKNRYEVWTDRKSPKNVEEYAMSLKGGVSSYDDRIKTMEESIVRMKNNLDYIKESLDKKLKNGKITQEEYNEYLFERRINVNANIRYIEEEINKVKQLKEKDPLDGGKVFDVTYPKDILETPIIDAENTHWAKISADNVRRDAPDLLIDRPYSGELDTDRIVTLARRKGYGVTHINNVMDTYNGTLLNETIIGRNTPVKSVLGNTGSFDINSLNKWLLYRSALPFGVLSGTALSTNKKAEGGSIHIAPSKRGTFTAAATKHGMGVQEFASKVLANKDNYSPAMVKKANFARNFGGHKHDLGGYLFEDGGPKNTNREYKSANSWSTTNLHKLLTPLSGSLMNFGKRGELNRNRGGTPEETYFLPKNIQRQEFLSRGYIEVPNDYGLVKKAVGNKDVPVYQTKKDDISREEVIPIGNIRDTWYGREEAALEHPGHYPTAVYFSPYTNEYYQKGWDLNDYGGGTGAYNNYPTFGKIRADIADAIGSPVVTTTGISRIGSLTDMMKEEDTKNIATDFLNSKGLVPMWIPTKELPILNMEGKPFYDLEGKPFTYTVNEFVPSLPEITITGKRRKKVK